MEEITSLIAELCAKVLTDSEIQAEIINVIGRDEYKLDPAPGFAEALCADESTPAHIKSALSVQLDSFNACSVEHSGVKESSSAAELPSIQTYLSAISDIETRDHMQTEILGILRLSAPSEVVAGQLADLLGYDQLELVQHIVSRRVETIETLEAKALTANMGKKLTRKEQIRQKRMLANEDVNKNMLFMTAEDAAANINRQRNAIDSREMFDPHAIAHTVQTYPHVYTSAVAPTSSFNRINYILPQGTKRETKKAYEEVTIPPPNLPPPRLSERILAIDELDQLCRKCFPGYQSLNRLQSVVYNTAYKTNENMLVCAPTGAGKTDVAVLSILRVVHQNLLKPLSSHSNSIAVDLKSWKVIYVAPMKALASEITRKFSKRLSWLGIKVKELTGDMQLTKHEIAETQIIITTPEKWDVVTRKSSSVGELKVRLLLIDEVHLLNEERGAVIETIVARTLRQVESSQSLIRIVGLSATLPNYIDVADFLRVSRQRGMFYFDAAFRPVPLEQHFVGIKGKTGTQLLKKGMDDVVYEKVIELVQQGHQVMVFVHSRKETVSSAKSIHDRAKSEGDSAIFSPLDHPNYDLDLRDIQKSRNKEMKDLFTHGFGIHNAGMLRSDRNMMERMFEDGTIRVLCCTATLAWGVNLPAHAVIIKGTQVYSSEKGAFTDLSVLDVLQIFGRSGRPGYSTSGIAWLCTSHDKLDNYIQAISMQHPIESRFISGIVDSLNAEINLGSVTSVAEAVQWLGYTYLYIRMRKNPLLYGMTHSEPVEDPLLGGKRLQVITSAARTLRDTKMISFDETKGTFAIEDIGTVAAKYYLRYSSIETYNKIFCANMSEADLLSMLCMSTEFDQIQIREAEVPELERLQKLHTQCQIKGGTQTNQGKVNILLQSSISRAFIEDFALVSDTAYVVQNGSRIIRALIDIAASKRWAISFLTLISLSKAIEKRVWPFQNPLRQLSTISPELMLKLEEHADDIEMSDLAAMDIQEVAKIMRINDRHAEVFTTAASHFPAFKISVTVIPLTPTLLQVDVALDTIFVWSNRMNESFEPLWVWIEDTDNSHIIQLHQTLIRPAVPSTQLQFFVPVPDDPLHSKLTLKVVSDRWIGCDIDQVLDISHIKLPRLGKSKTLNSSLPLVSIKSSENSELINVLSSKISSLNVIQSDCFWSIAHTDSNFLVTAPTGTGKFTLAQISMARALTNSESEPVRIVIITCRNSMMKYYKKSLEDSFSTSLKVDITEAKNCSDFVKHMQLSRVVVFVPSTVLWKLFALGNSDPPVISLLIIMDLQDLQVIDELVITKLMHNKINILRIGAFSRSIIDSEDLADWLLVDKKHSHHYSPNQRPVSLRTDFVGFSTAGHEINKIQSKIKAVFNMIIEKLPVSSLIFVSNLPTCKMVAKELSTLSSLSQGTQGFLNAESGSIDAYTSALKDKTLSDYISQGIGIYDFRMDLQDLHLVAQLFSAGLLSVCICSKETCWDTPFSSSNIIVLGTLQPHRNKEGDFGFRRYDSSELTQMQSLGSNRHDLLSGTVTIVTSVEDKFFYESALTEGLVLESKLLDDAVIPTGAFSIPDFHRFLTGSYLYLRIKTNPQYYENKSLAPNPSADDILDAVVHMYSKQDTSDLEP